MDDELAADFAVLGVQVAAETAQDDEDFEVMLANADTLRAWLASATQWRAAVGLAGMIWLGLDYAGVEVVLRRLGLSDPDAVFVDLQLMEEEALAVFGEAAT